jgi:hypothetical protein
LAGNFRTSWTSGRAVERDTEIARACAKFPGDDFIAAILIAFRSRLANAPDYAF